MNEPLFIPPAEDFEPPPELEPLPEPAAGTPQPADRDLPAEWQAEPGAAAGESPPDRLSRDVPGPAVEPPA